MQGVPGGEPGVGRFVAATETRGVSDYQPLSPLQAEQRMRELSRRLLEIVEERRKLAEELAGAIADYHQAFHKAHIESLVDHPKRKVAEHQSYAELIAADAYRSKTVLEKMDRSLADEAHSVRQILSALQTNARMMARLAGEGD